MKTVKAIILTYFKMAFSGLLGIFIIYLLLTTSNEIEILFWQAIGLSFLNFFFCFLFCLIFLLPVSILESERIKEYPVEELFKRYLPLITIFPLASVVWMVVVILPDVTNKEWNEYYFSISCVTLSLCVGPIGIWTFLNKLKSH